MTVATLQASGTDHRENADGYQGELFRHGDYRVAVCRDGIQWLLQRCDPGNSLAGARWRTLRYCVTRDALARLWPVPPQAPAPEINALPRRLRKKGGAA